jgi:hypothetical protein
MLYRREKCYHAGIQSQAIQPIALRHTNCAAPTPNTLTSPDKVTCKLLWTGVNTETDIAVNTDFINIVHKIHIEHANWQIHESITLCIANGTLCIQ